MSPPLGSGPITTGRSCEVAPARNGLAGSWSSLSTQTTRPGDQRGRREPCLAISRRHARASPGGSRDRGRWGLRCTGAPAHLVRAAAVSWQLTVQSGARVRSAVLTAHLTRPPSAGRALILRTCRMRRTTARGWAIRDNPPPPTALEAIASTSPGGQELCWHSGSGHRSCRYTGTRTVWTVWTISKDGRVRRGTYE